MVSDDNIKQCENNNDLQNIDMIHQVCNALEDQMMLDLLESVKKNWGTKKEAINHPEHYQSKDGIEVIDVIDSFDLNFNLGNCIKYILRNQKKGFPLQDLQKALWYLEREISNRMESNG